MKKETADFLKKMEEEYKKGNNKWNNCVDVARLFLKGGFAEEDKELVLNRSLIMATNHTNHYLVKYFAMHGANVNSIERKRIFQISKDKVLTPIGTEETPILHIAVKNNDEKTVQCFIEMGVNTNISHPNPGGKTALEIIAEKKKEIEDQNQETIQPLTQENLHRKGRTYQTVMQNRGKEQLRRTAKILDNIELLLLEPEKYRKEHIIDTSSFSLTSLQLDTITKTDIALKQEYEISTQGMILPEIAHVQNDMKITDYEETGSNLDLEKKQHAEISTSNNLALETTTQKVEEKSSNITLSNIPQKSSASNAARRLREQVQEADLY